KNPSSLLNCYKRLLDMRNKHEVLSNGCFEFIEEDCVKNHCLNYKRFNDIEAHYIYLNFSKEEVLLPCPVDKPDLLFSTLSNRFILDTQAYNGKIKLTPFEGMIFK
ncbi:MAG: DUF3459 domain-containing protein, partial [Candidatus Lokiarchaeota archaeon]